MYRSTLVLLLLLPLLTLLSAAHLTSRQAGTPATPGVSNVTRLEDTGFWLVAGTQLRRVGNLGIDCSTADELAIHFELLPEWILRRTDLFVGPSDAAPAGPAECYPFTHSFDLLSGGELNRVAMDNFTVPLNSSLLDENFCVHIAAHANVARLHGNLADNLEISPSDCCLLASISDASGDDPRDSFFHTTLAGQEFEGWSVESTDVQVQLDTEFCSQEIFSYDPILLSESNDWLMFPEFLAHANYLINNRERYMNEELHSFQVVAQTNETANATSETEEMVFCSWADIQLVLWRLLNNFTTELNDSTPECVDAIFADVMLNGADFVPCCGGDFLAFIIPTTNMSSNATASANATDEMCERDEEFAVTAIVRHADNCTMVVQHAEARGAVRPGGATKMNPIGSRMMDELLFGNGTQSFLIDHSDICAGVGGGMMQNGGAMGENATLEEGAAAGGEGMMGDEAEIERAFQWESTQAIFIRFCFPEQCRGEGTMTGTAETTATSEGTMTAEV